MYKAWPFQQAQELLKRIDPSKGHVLFETGYGPSGLPHIGTFGEVLRTSMVRYAFMQISDIPTRLYCVSDDMDGLRKVPDNVPNKDMLAQHLGKPLTQVPDPFGKYDSFGAHNNAKLQEFLDTFGFDYTFKSATQCYKSGMFDDTLKNILNHFDEIMAVMLPTLGAERQQTYCPFLPICPRTGNVLQVKAESINKDAHTITYKDPETGGLTEVSVLGGNCKLQWKIDWPMRWAAFDVDFEMYGKDLIDSVTIGEKVSKVIGTKSPYGFFCELFLDEDGKKISKSKGNGIIIEDWLAFAPPESLSLYMYQNPTRAKRLFFDVIPKACDEYLQYLKSFETQNDEQKVENPVWHIHEGSPPGHLPSHITFSVLLNLASVCNADNKDVLWGYVQRYDPNLTPSKDDLMDKMIEGALNYCRKFVHKEYRTPTGKERAALEDLLAALGSMPHGSTPEYIQNEIYTIGKAHTFDPLLDWFTALYEVLLGQSQGPRMGSFIALYGLAETCKLLKDKLSKP